MRGDELPSTEARDGAIDLCRGAAAAGGAPGAGVVRQKVLDQAALGSGLALMLADLLRSNGGAPSAVTPCGGAAHEVHRAFRKPWKTWRTREVWVLLAACAWRRSGSPPEASAWAMQAVVVSKALPSAGFGLFALRDRLVLTVPHLNGRAG